MQNRNEIQPPGWAQKFLAWYCKPSVLEDLEGDLHEYFLRNVAEKGLLRAKFIYIADVFKFIRPYTLRKPSLVESLIHYVMLGSYLKTSGRNIYRNKFFSAINIIGLAVSMSVGLLMIGMMTDILAYDKFHEKHDRIYRMVSRYEYNKRQDNDFHATTSMRAAKLLKSSVSGPEDVAILSNQFSGDLAAGDKTIPLRGLMADESFFNVFSFELIKGNPATALKNPFSLVLTETAARKLFEDQNVLGKTVKFNNDRDYTITGIVKDVPKFSHITFDMLGSLSTREITESNNPRELQWDNMWSTFAYVLMPTGGDLNSLRKNLNEMSAREDKTVKLTHIQLDLEPMVGIIAGENRSNQMGPVIGSTVIKIFGAMTFIVLLSACFNYTNLSIARSFKRSKEVGIRKTIGALRSHVAMQFIVESILISLLALLIAFLIFLVIKPHFLQMEYSLQTLLTLDLSPFLVMSFIAFAVLVGFFAGLFPAMFFSKLNAIQVLKNLSSRSIIKGLTMRKTLIVFQYAISIIFITGTSIIYKQYKHFLAFDLGFTTDNIVNIKLQGLSPEVLEKELREMPEVKEISASQLIMSVGNYYGVNVKYNQHDSAWIFSNAINERYLPVHNIKLLAGRNFNEGSAEALQSEIIVNTALLKRFNLSAANPEKAIGERVKVEGSDMEIVGVVDDFVYGRANSKTNNEVVLRYVKTPDFLNVKVSDSDWLIIKAKLESIWKRLDDVHPLDARLYTSEIEESYQGLQASIKLGGFIAFLVIAISSVGLLGMVVYTTETRIKEVSIRKVLGATEGGILLLLGRGFFILIAIAATIALPATYLFFDRIMLPQIGNPAPLALPEFLLGILVIVTIAVLMICSQTFKVAKANPANVLKAE